MTTYNEYGYLDEAYNEFDYNNIHVLGSDAWQIELVINKQTTKANQSRLFIIDSKAYVALEVLKNILNKQTSTAMQIDKKVDGIASDGYQSNLNILNAPQSSAIQIEANVIDFKKHLASQSKNTIASQRSSGFQTEFHLVDKQRSAPMQVETNLSGFPSVAAFETLINTVIHLHKDYYLEEGGYLEGPYLVGRIDAIMPMQYVMQIKAPLNVAQQIQGFILDYELNQAMQIELIIKDDITRGFQTHGHMVNWLDEQAFQTEFVINDIIPTSWQHEEVINFLRHVGWQISTVTGTSLGFQFRASLYNKTNLRVLYNFPSRGTNGQNWYSTSTATGDFSPFNLNTDIVEQKWQSVTNVTSVYLDCDTQRPQGIYLDTLAILNHNLSSSAYITLIGSDTQGGAIKEIHVIPSTMNNIFYVADEMPNYSSRWWRISIDDPTNPNNYLSIGTIVFGSSIIMHRESFVDRVSYTDVHYKDSVYTEGYTNVMNDRGVKKKLQLSFRTIDYNGGNFQNLLDVFDGIRTHLKALWIPTPTYASRFAIFGKLTSIPQREHNTKGEGLDWVDFTIEIDESL